jgi:ubiquinone biosynthesis protein
VGRILDPKFEPNVSIRCNVTALMAQSIRRDLTQGHMYSTLLEMKDFTAGLPARLNRILDAVADSNLEVKVKVTDAPMVMDGLQTIANRLTMGIVLAGLIVGASLLMRVATSFQLLGLPGLAILCFLASATGGFWLVVRIFVSDYRSRKKLTRRSGDD